MDWLSKYKDDDPPKGVNTISDEGNLKKLIDPLKKYPTPYHLLNKRIYNTVDARSGYPESVSNIAGALGNMITNSTGHVSTNSADQEIFGYSLGQLPLEKLKYWETSKHKPSTSKKKSANYIAPVVSNKGKSDLVGHLIENYNPTIKDTSFIAAGFPLFQGEGDSYDPLANYKVGFSKDRSGKYVSIYDKWDFKNPLANFFLTKKPEIYDRYYYSENKDYVEKPLDLVNMLDSLENRYKNIKNLRREYIVPWGKYVDRQYDSDSTYTKEFLDLTYDESSTLNRIQTVKNDISNFKPLPKYIVKDFKENTNQYKDGGNVTRDNWLDIYGNNINAYQSQQDVTKVVVPLSKKVNQEEYDYYNPEVEKGITSGDKRLDFLYNNQWLFNAPIVKNIIKSAAKKYAESSLGDANIDDLREAVKLIEKGYPKYTGHGGGKGMIDQFFGEGDFTESTYSPTSDYLTFLPSYSLKKFFNDELSVENKNESVRNTIRNILSRTVKKGGDEISGKVAYKESLHDKKNIYSVHGRGAEPYLINNADLGSYKSGIGWDKSIDKPYIFVSDAWDFEPNHYSKKWTLLSNEDGIEKERQRSKIQATLLNKAGKPFKIYDRFYFDPETQQYITDDSIQALKHSKGLTPIEDEVLNKDVSKYFPESYATGGDINKSNNLRNFTQESGWLDKYK